MRLTVKTNKRIREFDVENLTLLMETPGASINLDHNDLWDLGFHHTEFDEPFEIKIQDLTIKINC